jgi:hypothetical protein
MTSKYKTSISALAKITSLMFIQKLDAVIYSGLTSLVNGIIGEPEKKYIDIPVYDKDYQVTGYTKEEIPPAYGPQGASVYQALQSSGINLAFTLFSDGDQKSILFSSLLASLGLNVAIATIANFQGFERSISELFKFTICAGVNTAIMGGIDWTINHFIPEENFLSE